MIGLTVVPGTSTSLLVHKKTPWVPLFSKKEVNEKPRGKMDSRNDQFVYAQMKADEGILLSFVSFPYQKLRELVVRYNVFFNLPSIK